MDKRKTDPTYLLQPLVLTRSVPSVLRINVGIHVIVKSPTLRRRVTVAGISQHCLPCVSFPPTRTSRLPAPMLPPCGHPCAGSVQAQGGRWDM
ncbi:hypothetical protein BaRGS_00029861 [Batillaria attramentaria]|uniref:Uncharacterized protein n=1 Tax=Batillaria attramentaria TaxID=370345 RepID=A0ABD0JUV0_9CAEN